MNVRRCINGEELGCCWWATKEVTKEGPFIQRQVLGRMNCLRRNVRSSPSEIGRGATRSPVRGSAVFLAEQDTSMPAMDSL